MGRSIAFFCLAWLLVVSTAAKATGSTTGAADGDQETKEKSGAEAAAETDLGAETIKEAPQRPPEAVLRRYLYAREDEDWRWLAHGATQPDPFDGAKYRPFDPDDPERGSLSMGGELRLRFESIDHPSWNLEGTTSNQSYSLWRTRLHADWRLGPRFRFFTQIQAAGIEDREGGPRPSIDRDSLGVQQAFAEFDLSQGWLLRAGRQELSFGTGRLISLRAGPINVRQPQDGLRLVWNRGHRRVDLFAVRVVDTRPGGFDDSSSDGADLFGVYVTHGRPYVSPRGFEVYLFRFDRQRAVYFSGVGSEQRATAGARAWLRTGGWSHDAELIYQFGSFDGVAGARLDVAAWALASHSVYTFGSAPWQPSIELSTGFNSGDGDPADGEVETFLAPLPRGGYFGQFAPFGPGNLRGAKLAVSLRPRRAITITAGVYGFWRHRSRDGLYGVAGFPLLPPAFGVPSEDAFLGLQPEVGAQLQLGRHLEAELAVAAFDASDTLRQRGARDDITSAALTLRFVF